MTFDDLPILEAVAEELQPLLSPQYIIGCERSVLIIQSPAEWAAGLGPYADMDGGLRLIELANQPPGYLTAVSQRTIDPELADRMVEILVSAPVVMHYNTRVGIVSVLGQRFEVANPTCVDDIIALVLEKLKLGVL